MMIVLSSEVGREVGTEEESNGLLSHHHRPQGYLSTTTAIDWRKKGQATNPEQHWTALNSTEQHWTALNSTEQHWTAQHYLLLWAISTRKMWSEERLARLLPKEDPFIEDEDAAQCLR
jgi:hypothetical protein